MKLCYLLSCIHLPYILQHCGTYVADFVVSTCTGIGTGILAIVHDVVDMLHPQEHIS